MNVINSMQKIMFCAIICIFLEDYTLRAVDFFCGGGGMTNGLIQAGINVVAGVDLDPEAKATYEANNSPARFVNEDITRLPLDYFEKEL